MPVSLDLCRRWTGAATLAAAVTCALFALMHYLTAADNGGARADARPSLTLDFIHVERDAGLVKKQRYLPPKPKTVQRLKPPKFERRLPPRALQVPSVGLAYTPTVPIAGLFGLSYAREVAPLVRVSPVYPPHAERRGIEGWVKVAFTIAEDGGVVEPRVVEAEPKSVFDRAALRAVSKWRYQPQVIGGEVVQRSGVEVMIKFQLQE